ncbi:hypothetical protein [Sphingopyxis microcysteis]|uniref:hypothetical protein n=1 Tax=Sphingopyxis microcysteis TaxID=2484145 RepID=UPI0014485EBB|nr:hypothetical protein [Sphingopyxis microcysteis]
MLAKMVHAPGKRKAGFVDGGVGKIAPLRFTRHCERSEAIQGGLRVLWIASLRSQ